MDDIKANIKKELKDVGELVANLALNIVPLAIGAALVIGPCYMIERSAKKHFESLPPEHQKCLRSCDVDYQREMRLSRELLEKGWSPEYINLERDLTRWRYEDCAERCNRNPGRYEQAAE